VVKENILLLGVLPVQKLIRRSAIKRGYGKPWTEKDGVSENQKGGAEEAGPKTLEGTRGQGPIIALGRELG